MERNEKIEEVKIVEVIKVELVRGNGVKGSPVRKVIQYWDLKGNLINDDDVYLKDIELASSAKSFKEICVIEEICAVIAEEVQPLTGLRTPEMEPQAYALNNTISDHNIRNMHVLQGI